MSLSQRAAEVPGKALSQEQVDQFRVRGYLSLGKVLEDELVAQLREEYDRPTPPGTWSSSRNEYIPVSFSNPILRMRV